MATNILVMNIIFVKRYQVSLTPAYARIASTMAPYTPDILKAVLSQLQKDLDKYLLKKDQEGFQWREHTLRFICEFVKFGTCPPGVVLDAFGKLLDDFSGASGKTSF